MKALLGRLVDDGRARAGAAMVAVLTLTALMAPVIAPYDPIDQLDLVHRQLLPPSLEHPFGTDFLSRDLLSRMLFGARISLAIAFLAVLLSVTIGAAVGMLAGLGGRWLDGLLMRLVDTGLAVPRIFLLLVVLALWSDVGLGTLILILGATSWFDTSRIVRAEVLSLKGREFMVAARAVGVPGTRLLVRYVLPNVAAPLIVTATLGMGQIILIEAGLSFLGIGVQRPTPSWGVMIADGQREGLLTAAPWIAGFPGCAIVVTVIAFSLLGDALRDVLDPRVR